MNGTAQWISLVIAILTFAGIALTVWNSNRANKKATATHDLVNSRMDELLALTKSAAHAEGVKESDAASATQAAVAQTTAATAAAAAVASEIVAAGLSRERTLEVKPKATPLPQKKTEK